ncbi:chemotaxis protein [candidate division GN15 bacterium]|uniref:protein-glutamate O-methyltransferase n=1 Tax=candidate division GN15 bacterium TaxID=2072418 RepID=A0A855X0L8_9BACT|nr:MAG: chemotaxis protein [candidate division GN15 bacterium]
MIGTQDNDLDMSVEEFVMIRDFILERSGIYFAENKMYLVKNRLAKRMEELQIRTVRDYFYHVKYDLSMREFNRLMDLVTTNETSFFRNEPQLMAFSDEVMPILIAEKMKQKGPRTLKIWSAGCSTGEEPYTLAIQILEKLHSLAGWNVEIIANDISEQVLQRARQAEYSGITLRNVKPDLLTRYFIPVGEAYRIKPDVKMMVKFSHVNLNDPRQISMINGMDVIFCRNVMIYFSDEVKKQLVRGFYNALRPGGYYFIGHSETLHGISKAFKLVYFKNALVYQKEAGPQTDQPDNSPDTDERTAAPASSGAQRAMEMLARIKPVTAGK